MSWEIKSVDSAVNYLEKFQRELLQPLIQSGKEILAARQEVAAAQAAAAAAREEEARAKRAAAEMDAQAAKDADLITTQGRQEVERVRKEVTLLQGATDQLVGEVTELRAQKATLIDEVRQLVQAKTALQPTKA
jgi:chromosome segregation ATPase